MTVTTKAFEYLQGRGIRPDTIERESAAGNIELTDKAIIAKYRHIDGKREFKQYLNLDGSKLFQKGCKPSDSYFFSCGAKTKDADKIVITESVIDSLSVVEAIPNVTGIAIGGSQLYRKIKALPHKKKIVLAFDNDEAGNQVTENAVKLLDGAYIIPWGVNDPKDLNDLLKSGKRNRIKQLIDYAEWIEPEVFDREPELTEATETAPEETNPLIKNAIFAKDIQGKFEETLSLGWIVKDILPETANLSIIYGNYGTYKSFLITDMLLSIATGKDWHGKKTKKKKCLYITGEGAAGSAKRFVAWQIANNTKVTENFINVPQAARIDSPDDFKNLSDLVAQFEPEIVVFDTLARSMLGDENSTKDMNELINNLDKLTQSYGCQFILIHHSGKDKSRGARGNSALLGAVDVAVETISQNKNEVILRCEKMKDAEPFSDMGFTMEITSTGFISEEGDPINSLVPKYDPLIRKNQKPLEGQTRIAFDALIEVAEEGKANIGDWRNKCINIGLSQGNDVPAQRTAFSRAKKKLVELEKIYIDKDLVWIN